MLKNKRLGSFEKVGFLSMKSKYPNKETFFKTAASAGEKNGANLKMEKGEKKMNMKQMKKTLSSILCMMLIVAMALFTGGCNDKTAESETNAVKQEAEAPADTKEDAQESENTEETEDTALEEAEVMVLGEGETKFLFTVVDKEGAETVFEINTDMETVGDALLEQNLIEGEDGDFGLYVKTVNGITADYDTDGTYWAFYINDEYAMSGVDTTQVEAGASYSFKVEK